jgi:hypothetical protein
MFENKHWGYVPPNRKPVMSLINLTARDSDTDEKLANIYLASGRAWRICAVSAAAILFGYDFYHMGLADLIQLNMPGLYFAAGFGVLFAVVAVAHLKCSKRAGKLLMDRHYSAIRKTAVAEVKANQRSESDLIDYQMAVDKAFADLVASLVTPAVPSDHILVA